MQEQTDSGAARMLAPVYEKNGVVERELGVPQEKDVLSALEIPLEAAQIRDEAPFSISFGPGDIIHGFCGALSAVIQKGKTALLKKSGVGFHESGFDGFSIRELAEQTDLMIELCEAISVCEQFPKNERAAAAVFAAELNDFQYCFCGIDIDSIGRSDASSLLPVFENFKQACLQIVLKFLVDNSRNDEASRN